MATPRPAVFAVPDHHQRRRPLRVGVFGAGKAARFHLHALDRIEGVHVVGICSRSGDTADRLAAGRPGCRGTADPGWLADPDLIDAAIVAVDPGASAGLIRRLLETGIPVLAEKPAAESAGEARALAGLAEGGGVLALVGVNRRYYSIVAQGLATVTQRGPVRGVVVEAHEPTDVLAGRGAIGADQVRDWIRLNSIHFVDLLRMVGGEVDQVHPVTSGAPEASAFSVAASVGFSSGAVGSYVSHWNSGAPFVVRIYGDHVSAEITMSPPEEGFVAFTGGRRIRLDLDRADREAKPGVLAQDLAFLGAVATGRAPAFPASDLADHAASLALAARLADPGDGAD